MEQRILPLDEAEAARIEEQAADALALAAERYGLEQWTETEADIRVLQRILDDQLLAPDQTYALQCLGVVFGRVLAKQAGLHWIVVEDEYGRDPALQYAGTSLILFPLTMISKRVEQGQEVDVGELLHLLVREVEGLKDQVAPQEPATGPQEAKKPWWKLW
jgi:uncharacterized protein DUF3806